MTLDLIVLAADKDTEQALAALLRRTQALGIRDVRHRLIVHPQKDPGCYHSGEALLRPFLGEAEHALVILDLAWEGAPSADATALEAAIVERLRPSWGDRGACVVIDPEVEAWVWSDSPHVDEVLGWRERTPSLRRWLEQEGLWAEGRAKPTDPKTAFRRALRPVKIPPSAALFGKLAERVSVRRCEDPAFARLLARLRAWFGPETLT